MRTALLKIIIILIGLSLVSACATQSRMTTAFSESMNAPYKLDSGDRVRVIVFGQSELSNSFSVDASGRLSLPLVGNLNARGMTTQALEKAVASKLRQGYLRDPNVTVEVEIYRPFFALGEVNAPGRYAYVHGMTGRKAIAIAGGFSPRAVDSRIRITRVYRGEQVQAVVPIDHPLRPGDTIEALERWF